MAEAQSESMEDILQSIKKIIEDDTSTEAKPAEDVLDLTNVVAENNVVEPTQKVELPKETQEAAIKSIEAVFAETTTTETEQPADQDLESLISEQATNETVNALKPIARNFAKDFSIPNIPSAQFRGGNTVEDLVLESLRPMLKEWLDNNLPIIVQKIVEKEVKRLVTFHYD